MAKVRKSGVAVRYKIGDKSNYVRRGPNYHIPLRNPCEHLNPTKPLNRLKDLKKHIF